MSVAGYIPKRGDLVWLTFTPHAGSEQSGRRPGLVLSPERYNARTGLAVICPVTSRIKGYPFEVLLDTGMTIQGVILADQLKSVDWRARNAEFIETVPAGILSAVLARITGLFEP